MNVDVSDSDSNHEEEEQNEDEGLSGRDKISTKISWNPKWRKKSYGSSSLPVFEEYCGPNKNFYDEDSNGISPIDIFKNIVDEELLQSIAFQTNLYATQKEKSYKPTNVKELEIFIGINFLMAMKKQPAYRDYWSSDPFYNDSIISNAMLFDRFTWLLTHIHLNDNSTAKDRNDPGFDKLHKVRPYLDHLKKKFGEVYFPTENQSIDESMIKFKGRSSLKHQAIYAHETDQARM